MAQTVIIINHDESAADINQILGSPQGDNDILNISALKNYINALAGGARNAQVVTNAGCTLSSQTFTGSTVAATNTAVINAVTFTAVASGAGANQFNIGLSDAESMYNLAQAINASTTAGVKGLVLAIASGSVVTIYITCPATRGDGITTTATGGITAGGASTAGAASGTKYSFAYGSSTRL